MHLSEYLISQILRISSPFDRIFYHSFLNVLVFESKPIVNAAQRIDDVSTIALARHRLLMVIL